MPEIVFCVQTQLLTALRTARGITRQALSESSRVSMRTLARIESGEKVRTSVLLEVLKGVERFGALDAEETIAVTEKWGIKPVALEKVRELVMREETPPIIARPTTHEAQNALRAFERAIGLMGAERVYDMLNGAIQAERTRQPDSPMVKFTGEPFQGPDGRMYTATVYQPAKAAPATRAQAKRKNG